MKKKKDMNWIVSEELENKNNNTMWASKWIKGQNKDTDLQSGNRICLLATLYDG